MSARILDTSVLLRHWHRCCTPPLTDHTPQDAERWGKDAIRLFRSACIVTPVYVKIIVGTRSADELRLTEQYLAQFEIVDQGSITEADWEQARRIARRVPRSGKPRHLGDCLIRSVANRLRRKVYTLDQDFPR